MKWTKWQLEFMNDHPEVFDGAEDPSALYRRIESFTKYHFNDGEVLELVLGWVEARKFGVAFTGKIVDSGVNRRLKLYLKGPIVNEELLILVVSVYEGFTSEQVFEAVKLRFDSEYLFPLSDLPYIYNGIKNLIIR